MTSKLELIQGRRNRISDFLASFNIFDSEASEYFISTPFNSLGGYTKTRAKGKTVVNCVIEAIGMLLNLETEIDTLNIDSRVTTLNIEDHEGTGILSVSLDQDSVLIEVVRNVSEGTASENTLRIIWQ
ncbi:MAG: hypothetical protein ACFFBD_01720 [Candidatus Hodarchaeota archaeon]